MAGRASSLQRANVAIGRDLDSRYDDVKLLADNFDYIARYLGALTNHPIRRPNTDPLKNGDYYLNVVGPPSEHEIYYYSMPSNTWVAMHKASEKGEHLVFSRVGGGGLLLGDVENHIHDGSAYTMVSASSVDAMTTCNVILPDAFRNFTPSISFQSGDTVFDGVNSDTAIEFRGPARIQLTSDGISKWNLDTIKGHVEYE